MSFFQHILTILICAFATVCTRFLPFALFGQRNKHASDREQTLPGYIVYLGRALPAAIFGMLVVYCLKNTSLLSGSHGLPEAIAIVLTVFLHMWQRKMILSIAAGTVCYMLLVQMIFIP